MRVEVLKAFHAGDTTLRSGEIVDASRWRLLRQLIDQRYVREAPQGTEAPKGAKGTKETSHA